MDPEPTVDPDFLTSRLPLNRLPDPDSLETYKLKRSSKRKMGKVRAKNVPPAGKGWSPQKGVVGPPSEKDAVEPPCGNVVVEQPPVAQDMTIYPIRVEPPVAEPVRPVVRNEPSEASSQVAFVDWARTSQGKANLDPHSIVLARLPFVLEARIKAAFLAGYRAAGG